MSFFAAARHLFLAYRDAGHPVKSFITDYDTVMRSEQFRSMSAEHNVSLKFSSPYSHWQNGPVERAIYTLKNKTICNLRQSGLDDSWWYPALAHAASSHNATPTATNPANASPRNVWFGRVHMVDGSPTVVDPVNEWFRRAFGADAYVRTEVRTSLQPRADKCTFLTYPKDHADGVHEFVNHRTGRLVRSRDCIFDERGVVAGCDEFVRSFNRNLPAWMEFDRFRSDSRSQLHSSVRAGSAGASAGISASGGVSTGEGVSAGNATHAGGGVGTIQPAVVAASVRAGPTAASSSVV